MTSLRLATLLIAALAAAGCRTSPSERAAFDAYQEELRRYEGIIYDLEYNNETLCLENERLKERIAGVPADRTDEGGILSPRRDRPLLPVPPRSGRGSSGARPADEEPDLSPPVIELGESPDEPPVTPRRPPAQKPVAPDGESPPLESPPAEKIEPPPGVDEEMPTAEDAPDAAPPVPKSILAPPKSSRTQSQTRPTAEPTPAEVLPAPARQSPTSGSSSPELLPAPQDKKVSQLFIDPRHTRGLDLDRHSGDDGLRVVIEPRNSAGEFVPTAGKVSVVVLDPARQGEAARVGRWEFETDYVQYQLRLAGQRNIPLELPWTGEKPQNTRLQMFVRLETASGDRVEATRDVTVLLPGQISSRWTPRPAARSGPLSPSREIAAAPAKPAAEVEQVAHVEERGSGTSDQEPGKAEEEASEPAGVPEWKPFR